MFSLGSIMAIAGLALLWFDPYTGLLIMIIGLGLVWTVEDQKIKKKAEKIKYEEEKETEFAKLKYTEPVSVKLLELSTQLYGSIKAHETWLLQNINSFEDMYAGDPNWAVQETQNVSNGKFGNLFADELQYYDICNFLNREYSNEIYEDIQKFKEKFQLDANNEAGKSDSIPTLSDVLEEYDLEQWAKEKIKIQIASNKDRNEIITYLTLEAKKELSKDISVSCLRDEWILNGTLRFKI